MPLYDYLYDTLDPISDDLHRRVRLQGPLLLLLPASMLSSTFCTSTSDLAMAMAMAMAMAALMW
jgi:hypothetical protein